MKLLRWFLLLVYFLVSVECFNMIISSELSLSISFLDMGRRRQNYLKSRKTHSSASCFLLHPLIPFP